jgi:exo-1,4-beta-D-glucosaminidase
MSMSRLMVGALMQALLAGSGSQTLGAQATAPPAPERIELARGWSLQSSAHVTGAGAAISTAGFDTRGWYTTTVPTTLVAALVAAGVYADPYFGMNLRTLPGETYPIGGQFSNLPMPDDSPFRVSWWYRTEFSLPAGGSDRHVMLHFDGISYRANIWLNGHQIAGRDSVAGTWRLFAFDITKRLRPGVNALAVEVFAPEQNALALTWVDWNPTPPDKDAGLWRPVYLTISGPVTLERPFVETALDSANARAALTVSAAVSNRTSRPVRGRLRGRIGDVAFAQEVTLQPNETRTVHLSPDAFPQLVVTHPRLWWPAELGTPNLYQLDLAFETEGGVSDQDSVRFGIRSVTSEFSANGGRVFRINGRRILIRGGGWAPDMLLRVSHERQLDELRYVLDMHLNTVRLEGKLEDERFFELTDSLGVLVMAGWCCCGHWEHWDKWTEEDHRIAQASQRDQIARLRGHPSVFVWLNGSDNPPPPDVERMYVDVLKQLHWPNPYLSSATARPTTVTGSTGVKMTGPYDWVPPAYWLVDTANGGAYGFITETSPGPAVPPIESLKRMLPPDHLWPPDSVWDFHAGGGEFKTINLFTDAQNARYGAAISLADFTEKAQLMAYEGERAMFEAYTRNKYAAGGVIQWMLNNAWPSLIWHLYDYYLRPAGGYFGTKKACEQLHAMYSYDDRSVVVTNGGDAVPGVAVRVRLLDVTSAIKFERDTTVAVPADSSIRVLTLPDPDDLSSTYFLDVRLAVGGDSARSVNFYWLSTKQDEMDFAHSKWYTTPVRAYADFTALHDLPTTQVTSAVRYERDGSDETAHVTLSNPGQAIAFFVRLQIVSEPSGEEVLPVLWQDNYVSLLPGETRDVVARYRSNDAEARRALVVSGWNVPRTEQRQD